LPEIFLKDYYKILQVSHLATEVEIKRSYRKLVAQYHPDVNPALDAHSILTELNEAYAILSDPVSKKTYDLIFLHPEILANMPLDVSFENKPRKRRHGKKETIEEREKKKGYALKRNRHFNKKMKYCSLLTLLLAGAIFFDHYLPTVQECQKVYVGQKPSHLAHKTELVSFFLAKGRKIEAYAVDENYPKATISCAEAIFHNSSLFGVLKNIQLEGVLYKPIDSLFDLMLIYGLVCLSSIYVLGYKLEASMVLPGVLTFFNNMLVVAFFVLWLSE